MKLKKEIQAIKELNEQEKQAQAAKIGHHGHHDGPPDGHQPQRGVGCNNGPPRVASGDGALSSGLSPPLLNTYL